MIQRRLDQGKRILEMLTTRPHTNAELSDVALKYTSRISDLRHEGHDIKCERVPGRAGRAGLTVYTLLDDIDAQGQPR